MISIFEVPYLTSQGTGGLVGLQSGSQAVLVSAHMSYYFYLLSLPSLLECCLPLTTFDVLHRKVGGLTGCEGWGWGVVWWIGEMWVGLREYLSMRMY
jgi:hypothetical protein